MKNKEKYAEQIVEFACEGGSFGFDKYAGVIVPCRLLSCTDCSFYQSADCDKRERRGLNLSMLRDLLFLRGIEHF